MRILWGALRAVSVETLGILVVLWMVHGATGLSSSGPWLASSSRATISEPADVSPALVARTVTATMPPVDEEVPNATPRTTVRQWFSALFHASANRGDEAGQDGVDRDTEQRIQYTRQRLEHFSRLYGIATRE